MTSQLLDPSLPPLNVQMGPDVVLATDNRTGYRFLYVKEPNRALATLDAIREFGLPMDVFGALVAHRGEMQRRAELAAPDHRDTFAVPVLIIVRDDGSIDSILDAVGKDWDEINHDLAQAAIDAACKSGAR